MIIDFNGSLSQMSNLVELLIFSMIICGIFVYVICLIVLSVAPNILQKSRVIRTRHGVVRGMISQPDPMLDLDPVEVFLGIPYASPPVGALRFMPPTTTLPWRGVRNANRYPPVCPQRLPNLEDRSEVLKKMSQGRYRYLKRRITFLKNQSEDCLYLNLYAPISGKEWI